MKIKTILLFLPLLLCGALFAEFRDSDDFYLESEYDQTSECEDDWDNSNKDNEPPIQGLFTQQSLSLKNNVIILDEYLNPNPEITTYSGADLFLPTNDGVRVEKSGLYRVSFFQRIRARGEGSSFLVYLMRTPGNYPKRYQIYNLNPWESREIEFTQIVRLKRGEKVKTLLNPMSGEATLFPGKESSGFTIEAISVN